jgi:hypothetical protein
MIAPILLAAAIIIREPVVPAKPPTTVTDSWLCSHVSVFFCPIFPTLGASAAPAQSQVVKPRKP